MGPQISFIIVNWNGGELLKHCLESIARHKPNMPGEVVVVDNASTDGSREWLQSIVTKGLADDLPLHLIANEVNEGFGKANNRAFAYTKTPLVFLLNPDAQLTAGAFDWLLHTLRSDERIGVCGPRIVNPDGSLQISVWRNPPTAWATLLSGTRVCSLLPRKVKGELLLGEHWDHDRRRDVGMLGGAALLVRREVIDQVGGFDERFHMYGEDTEWCLRVKRAGWRLVFEPEAVVLHQGGHSSLRRWSELEKLQVQTKAYLMFLHECLRPGQVFTNLVANVSLLTLQKTWRRIRNRPADDVNLVWSLQLEDLKALFRRPS